ncbi:MAG: hypothetical protein M1511_04940 [Deltaproteobacteria bacterium]|nr:hypothetical protein [Deltaproteobacteria bacterium]
MQTEKAIYFNLLSQGNLSQSTIDSILDHVKSQGLHIAPVPQDLIKKNKYGEKISEYLTRLNLSVVEGNPSWEGLLVGFPGDYEELSTKSVGTPYLRMILYPILDLHHRLKSDKESRFPCIYFVGKRFSDVFLRKFELLKDVVPNIIVLTHDIYECAMNKSLPPITEESESRESWTQMSLSQMMNSKEGLFVPTKTKKLTIKYLSSEVPCNEGTEYPERLDILGYDAIDHGLVAFELKGLAAGRMELENLFLQGIEHRNWIEKNKMAVKLLFDGGPKGKRINTRKRVRLLLGFYGETVPHIFNELRDEAIRRDPYTEIDFVRLLNEGNKVTIDVFENP